MTTQVHTIHSIPISQIKTSDRMREDYGDIEEMKESLEQWGLMQPIGVRWEKASEGEADTYRLVWGGRRCKAAQELGWETIEARFVQCEEDYQLREYELEENIRRKDMTWQEKANSMYEIHRLKVSRKALIGEKWGFRETGAMLGISVGNVSYTLSIAQCLRKGDAEIKQCSNMADALRILMKRKEEELQNEKRTKLGTQKEATTSFFSKEDLSSLKTASETLKKNETTSASFSIYNITTNETTEEMCKRSPLFFVRDEFAPLSVIYYLEKNPFGVAAFSGDIESLTPIFDKSFPFHGPIPLICQDQGREGNSIMPFKENLDIVFLFYGEKFQKAHAANQCPFMKGNSTLETKAYGHAALDSLFLNNLIETFTKPDEHILIRGKAADMLVRACRKNRPPYLFDFDSSAKEVAEKELTKYGTVTNIELHK